MYVGEAVDVIPRCIVRTYSVTISIHVHVLGSPILWPGVKCLLDQSLACNKESSSVSAPECNQCKLLKMAVAKLGIS